MYSRTSIESVGLFASGTIKRLRRRDDEKVIPHNSIVYARVERTAHVHRANYLETEDERIERARLDSDRMDLFGVNIYYQIDTAYVPKWVYARPKK